MNILFFITPKSETAYLYDDCSLRQAIEKIEYHKYTAVPVLNKKGCYVGTLTEGDLLRIIKERYLLNYHEAGISRSGRFQNGGIMSPSTSTATSRT